MPDNTNKLTHLDSEGNVLMVDVSAKDITLRTASAKGSVFMESENLSLIITDGVKKGDVISAAKLAVKLTSSDLQR